MDGLAEKVFQAGVVGCGGAGFPTHVKLRGPVKWFIVNGVECEPLLRSDRHLMRRFPGELVETASRIAGHLRAERFGIALKKTYGPEIAALEEAVAKLGSRAELFKLDPFYPAGDEQVVVEQVTGMTVPPAGVPPDIGVAVSNAATVLAVRDALEGIPLTHRILTVAGAVARPAVIRTPVGTPLAECLALAGGAAVPDHRVIDGGPLMGKLIERGREAETVVRKTTSGFVVVPADSHLALLPEISVPHTVNRARSACVQCSFCTLMCPRHLIGHPLRPHLVMRKLAHGGGLEKCLDDPEAKQALLCCECGVCELYACPMSLQPRRVNVLFKRKFAEAGVRYGRAAGEWAAREEFESRKIPTGRIAARAGLSEYHKQDIQAFIDHVPDRIRVPLRQHIGAPAIPAVKVGDAVRIGQLIASCPAGELGANIHAGIDGVVTAVDARIDIERGLGGVR